MDRLSVFFASMMIWPLRPPGNSERTTFCPKAAAAINSNGAKSFGGIVPVIVPAPGGFAEGGFFGALLLVLPHCRFSRTLKSLDVHLTNPDLQAKLDRWVTETGRGPDELVEDALAGYFDELARTRHMLDSRYDDLKSGKVKPIDGQEFFENLRRREDELLKKYSPQ